MLTSIITTLYAQVKTVNGLVAGTIEKSGVRSYKGIPYAAPPVGDLRWKAPQPVKNWQGVRKADHFGPRAMQPPIFSDMVFRSDGEVLQLYNAATDEAVEQVATDLAGY